MRLVTVAHGTRYGPGNEVARRVTELAGRRLGLPSIASYVELCEPTLASVLAASSEPTVVVPLLLSSGHHLRHDLPSALCAATGPVRLAQALGPHPLLAQAQTARLRAAGAVPGAPVVMVAAGSRDPSALSDLDEAVRLLVSAWGGPVRLATLSGPGPRPADVVTPAHAVSPYLLAPGHFAHRASVDSVRAGWVGDVLGTHPAVVELVVDRALANLPRAPSSRAPRWTAATRSRTSARAAAGSTR